MAPYRVKDIRPPVLLVGFKTYLEATGRRALSLSKLAEQASQQTSVPIAVIPQYTDIPRIAETVDIPIFAQHIDPIEPGSHTGYILPEAIIEAGASGTLINHSEKPLHDSEISETIRRAREVGLVSCVCCDSPQRCASLARYGPDMILVEIPELIGTGKAISKSEPEMLKDAIRLVRSVDSDILLICGAGISNSDDVSAAMQLGADGVGVASAVVKSRRPLKVLLELASALRTGDRTS